MEATTLQPPQAFVYSPPQNDQVVKIVVLGVLGFVAYKAYKKHQQDQETLKIGTDPMANLASQIESELSAAYTNDDKVISLFQQTTDFNALATAFRAQTGQDIKERTKQHVSATAFQKILNIIGYSANIFKPGQPQTKAVALKGGLFIVAKADAYLRKTPVIPTCSRFVPDRLCYLENVITQVKAGDYLGFSTANNVVKQAEFTDKKAGVIFIEVQVTDHEDPKKSYLAYIAASMVNAYPQYSTKWNFLKVYAWQYNAAKAPLNGINQFNNLI